MLLRTQVLASVAALAVCLAVPAGLVQDDYLRTVLWGGAILASAVGGGAIVARRLYGHDARVGWGLEAALGMAVHLALGGLLAMLSLVSVTTCYVAVTLGVALFAREAWRRAAAEAAPPDPDTRKETGLDAPSVAGMTVVILFFGVALLHYLGMAAERPANIVDDFQAYFSFPKQLLASGTLIEPFSSRRIDAYGGQSYLQALVLACSTVSRIGVLDNGICVLVLAGLVVGWVRERPHLPLAVAVPALLGLFTLHYYDLNHNAASEFSGAVFFLAIFRVLDRPRRVGESAWAHALALALVAFAACTLRQTNLCAAAVIPAVYYGARMAREGDARRRWAHEAALATLFSLAFLLPWMVLAYRSCGTALYPLILGNGAKNIVSFEPISAVEKARYFVVASMYPGRLPGLLLAFTAGLFVPSRASVSLRASLAGTALATIMLFNALAPADAVESTNRYLFPYGLAYVLAVSLVAARAVAHPTIRFRRSMVAMALVVGALVLQLVHTRDTLAGNYLADEDAVKAALANPARSNLDPGHGVYAALQRAVPEHATLLVMLDQPFRLDFNRNRILSWDQPGAASPSPHLPIREGPDALAQYLLGQGIRYVAYCDGPPPEYIPDAGARYALGQGVRYVAYCDGPSPEYNHSLENLLHNYVPSRDGNSDGSQPLRNIARLYVDIFANLQKLTATRKHLYADNGIKILDLATPAPSPP
jgi:hypothetical protein